MAKILGQNEFTTLNHQGKNESIQLTLVGDRTILATIYDLQSTTPGMVMFYTKELVEKLNLVFKEITGRKHTGVAEPFYQTPATLTTPTTGWQVQLLFTLPLYDGGNRYGLKHERDALYDEAKVKLDAALRQARSDVRIGFEAMQRSDEALAQARDAARFAQEALELSQLAYRAGATTNIEVVDAERRARDAATEAAIAEDAARQARLDLLSAAGRFP